MLFFHDGVRAINRSSFILFVFVVHVMLTSCRPVAGCIYDKYFQMVLKEEYATVYQSMGIQSVLECEQICLEHGFICVGANVIGRGKHQVCLLFSAIRTPIIEDMRLNRNGKLIVKTKGLCKDGVVWRFRTSYYCLNKKILNQTDAMIYCKSIGAQLISIETMEEFYYIKRKLSSEDIEIGNVWTSARKDRNSDVYRWASGLELPNNSGMWAPGEPNGSVQCVLILKDPTHTLNNVDCRAIKAFMCERQLG